MVDSVISRVVQNTSVFESTTGPVVNSYAVAYYSLSSALATSTSVNVSVSGTGGANAADYSGLQWRMGNDTDNLAWTSVSGASITLNAGYADFQLRVLVSQDSVTEIGEGVSFVVAQNNASVGLSGSYWVPAQVDITDPRGTGGSAFSRTITKGTTTPGTEGSTAATANYTISGGGLGNPNLADYAATEVQVSITTGLGGATAADYTAFRYDVGAGPVTIANNGLISIPASVTSFSLSALLATDTLAEANEQLLFTVSQTNNSVGLINSWGVQNTVDLVDQAGTGVNTMSRTISAGTPTTGVEGVTAARANYTLAPNPGTAAAEVRVGILTGLGGSSTADYTQLRYNVGGGDVTIANNGLISIPASVTSFSLSAVIPTDSYAEASEQLIFTVAQTTTNLALSDSWWVPSIVDLQDAAGFGAAAQSRTITAGTATPGVEGGTAARAAYVLTGSGPGTGFADAQVRVGILTGLGGSSTADYAQLRYNVGGGDVTIANNGLITIPGGVTGFSLSALIGTDTYSEASEQLIFTVANTGTSPALTDSWWVTSTVDLQDAQGAGASAYPRTITAGTPTTGMEGTVDWGGSTPAPAKATFNVSHGGTGSVPNDYASTQVRVTMYGTGGANAADYSGFKYHMGTAAGVWLDVPVGGLITIDASATAFQLASYALTDSNTETGEGITFTVSQTASSVGLVDSWWVTSTADLADVAAIYTVLTGAGGQDRFTATGSREMFVIPAGSSLAQAGLFDTITGGIATGLTSGDLISVGGAQGTISAYAGSGSLADEAALLASILAAGNGSHAARDIGYYAIGADLYLVINTDGGATFNAGDALIKIVGGGAYTPADIDWLFA